jgi:Domain of unknown function (DUF4180)
MSLRIHVLGAARAAEVVADEPVIRTVQDALDLMAAAAEQDVHKIVLNEHQLSPEFFELRTGLAGEVLQKFVNYGVELSIIGDFAQRESRALQAFILECNRGGPLSFTPSLEAGLARLAT